MINKSKIATAFLSAAIILSASVTTATAAGYSAVSQTEKAYSVVTNGKLLDDVSAFEEYGIISVQLAPVVKAMGENIEWDNGTQTAIITKKDQTIVKVGANKSVATVNGKDVILSTKKIGNVIVPSSARAASAAGKLFVPVEAFKNAFGYSVQMKDKGSDKIIMIQESSEKNKKKEAATPVLKGGKLDLPYPAPKDWVPPLVVSTATEDFWANNSILEKELGLINGSFFNPHGGDQIELAKIQVGNGNRKTDIAQISFTSWYGSKSSVNVNNKIPYLGREIFKFYLPNDYQKLFEIVDQGLTGNLQTSKFLDKEFTFDGRKVTIKKLGNGISIFISKQK
ncbi:copper amine oxidase N-terminal domain-containing protein [Brevibacillus agri]|uniref:copper amine oxidase N-terminal domain-containing protein n=1 Tax=Brevibacillus TaxID=55080 RepID=UPI002E22487E|nr:copper amine oxidase N-terminal domain-containing protein [Brevibacillus borstelensis]